MLIFKVCEEVVFLLAASPNSEMSFSWDMIMSTFPLGSVQVNVWVRIHKMSDHSFNGTLIPQQINSCSLE